jgi:hypothetical protein
MSSTAYAAWTGDRAKRLNQLIAAHGAVGGSGLGADSVNWASTLMLAGEFQGFCRDLHDEALDFFVSVVAPNSKVASILQIQLTRDRKLDRGNARPETLKEDFVRIGIDVREDVDAADPIEGPRWWAGLAKLNEARNAIAHANHAVLVNLQLQGYPVNQPTVLSWRRQLDGLARTMDDVVAKALDAVLGAGRPW